MRDYLATLCTTYKRHGLTVEPVDNGTLVTLKMERPHLTGLFRTERSIYRILDIRLLANPIHVFVKQIKEHYLMMKNKGKNEQRTPDCHAVRVLETGMHKCQRLTSILQERWKDKLPSTVVSINPHRH